MSVGLSDYMRIKPTRLTKRIIKVAVLLSIITVTILSIKSLEHKSTIIVDNAYTKCYSINCRKVSLPIEKPSPKEIYEIQKQVEYMKGIERRKVELAKIAEEKRLAEIERIRLVELEAKRIAKLKEKEEAKKKQTVSRGSGYKTNYEATFYTAQCEGCTGKSASGQWVNKSIYYQGYRVVAAPPGVPFFTKLKIELANGEIINAIVLDRGGDIKGKRLDILVATKSEAIQLGRQQVTVEVVQ